MDDQVIVHVDPWTIESYRKEALKLRAHLNAAFLPKDVLDIVADYMGVWNIQLRPSISVGHINQMARRITTFYGWLNHNHGSACKFWDAICTDISNILFGREVGWPHIKCYTQHSDEFDILFAPFNARGPNTPQISIAEACNIIHETACLVWPELRSYRESAICA